MPGHVTVLHFRFFSALAIPRLHLRWYDVDIGLSTIADDDRRLHVISLANNKSILNISSWIVLNKHQAQAYLYSLNNSDIVEYHSFIKFTPKEGMHILNLNTQCPVCWRPCSVRVNPLRPRQNGHHSQTTFSNAFSWMKIYEFLLTFHWSLFLKVKLTISQHWFR